MLTMIRRTIAYLLTFALVLSLLPPQYARAEETETVPTEETELSAILSEMETLPTETEAVETQPAETEPLETQPAETEPAETQPAETEPAETQPAETEPLEIQPAETEPAETQPAETEPLETQPVETEPAETQPAETEPAETQPAETEPPETQPAEFFYAEEIPDDFTAPFSHTGSGVSFFSLRIPSAYDSREADVITPVRNQNDWQLCWAFSALAVGESYLLSSGQEAADLSERHLGYYFHGRATDPLGYAVGDGTYLTEDYLISGNNNKFTTFALANWVGAATEEKYPYDKDPSRQENASAMDDAVHLSNAYWISAQDTDNIKYYIMRNGSVGLSIYYKESYYNPETTSYYNNAYTATNHAITVVGWDDDYSFRNFTVSPGGSGAWLCKNSHGSDFGEEGYFWLSYYDKAISHASATAFVFEFESGNNYDWNYHHDGSFGTATKNVPNGGRVANIYTASGSTDGTDEEIRAIGFAPADADLNYSIQIYRNLTDPSDPTSGTAALSQPQTGQTGLCGYYTIPLDEPVRVRQGEMFSVVVTLHSEQLSNIRYFVDQTYQNGSWIRFNSVTSPCCSFYGSPSGEWTDLVEVEAVARIKAYTVSTGSRSVSRLFFETEEQILTPGETFFQEPGRLPENADYCMYRWSSDREEIASVSDDGIVTAIDCGEAVITASTEDGRISASYRVCVKPKISAINLRKIKTAMTTGESFETQVEIFPASAVPYYTVTLESSDESVISVSGQTLQANAPGVATVTFWAKPYYRECTVTVTRSLDSAQLTVKPTVYDGSSLEPAVSVLLEGTTLERDRDYTLSFTNNRLPGTGKVTATGIGSYSGTLCQTFTIGLPESRILSLENAARGIRVTWESCSQLSGYYLYRQKNSGSWKQIKAVSGVTSWLDEGASASGAEYAYKIVPYLSYGKEIYRAAESAQMTAYRLLTPQISAVNLLDSGVEIRWKKVSGADSYQILRSTPDTPEEILAVVPGGDSLRWTDTSAAETGLRYTYRVVAQRTAEDIVSLSAASEARSVYRPEMPAGLAAVNSAKGITLSWEKADHATGYEIQRSTNGTRWTTVKTVSGGNTLSWTNTSVSSGFGYYYRVCTLTKIDRTTFRSEYSEIPVIYRLSGTAVKEILAVADGFKVTWNRISGADAYRIYRRSDGAPAELLATVDGNRTLIFTDDTANETGKNYFYAVAAWKRDGEHLYLSNISAEKAAIHPAAPTGFTAVNSARGIVLTWEKADYATGYEVQRSTNGTRWATVKTISGGNTLSWTDSSRSSGSGYYYRIRTLIKLNGTTYRSDFFEIPIIYRLPRPTVKDIRAASSGFRLTWNRVSGADGYRIYRHSDEASVKLLAIVDGEKILSYTDNAAADTGKIYSYSVVAWKEAKEGLQQSEISAERSALHPEKPTGLAAANNAKGIALTWKKADHATGYEIQRSTNGTRWTTVKTISGGNTLSWTDTSRKSGSGYHYRIRSLVKLNGTTYRSEYFEIPVMYRLSRPAVKEIRAASNGFRLTWNRVSGADGYRIYRSSDGKPAELLATVHGGRTLLFTDNTAKENGKNFSYSVTAWKEMGGHLYQSEISVEKTVQYP